MSRFKDLHVYNNKSPRLNAGEKAMFPWGRIVAVHKFGTHEIIEYLVCESCGSTVTDVVSGRIAYHVNGFDCDVLNSLDAAILVSIAKTHDGINSDAGRLFAKALGIVKE